ncbi:hypothetical protein JOC74_002833 [Bacillus capparidis]|uniref:Uncharacterized protein n=1 Tax=Bacillus capparidis TaxID=1840411 RepID=A0ABS4CY88_9BACI|nr:hypothetical protein [Bacillus capparidis]
MHTKQVIAGKLSEEEIKSLQPKSEQHHGEHSHH